jgi:hypothetical protein
VADRIDEDDRGGSVQQGRDRSIDVRGQRIDL